MWKFILSTLILTIIAGSTPINGQGKFNCDSLYFSKDDFTNKKSIHTEIAYFSKVDYNPIGDFINRKCYISKDFDKQNKISYKLYFQITNAKERTGMKGAWIVLENDKKIIRETAPIKSEKLEVISLNDRYKSNKFTHSVTISLSVNELDFLSKSKIIKYRLGEFDDELSPELSSEISFYSECLKSAKFKTQ